MRTQDETVQKLASAGAWDPHRTRFVCWQDFSRKRFLSILHFCPISAHLTAGPPNPPTQEMPEKGAYIVSHGRKKKQDGNCVPNDNNATYAKTRRTRPTPTPKLSSQKILEKVRGRLVRVSCGLLSKESRPLKRETFSWRLEFHETTNELP